MFPGQEKKKRGALPLLSGFDLAREDEAVLPVICAPSSAALYPTAVEGSLVVMMN